MTWNLKAVHLASMLRGEVVAELGDELFGGTRFGPVPMRDVAPRVCAKLGAPRGMCFDTLAAWQALHPVAASWDNAGPTDVGCFLILLLTRAAGLQRQDGMPVFEVPPGRIVDYWLSRRIGDALATGTKPADEIDFFPAWGWARARTEGRPNHSYALF